VDESSLVSPFASSVEDLTIPNAHVVAKAEGEVLRGMAPRNKIPELAKHGVTDVLIFKDEIKGDVTREKADLQKAGFTADHIHAIPFLWRNIPSYQSACEQMIDALKILEEAYHSSGRSAFFHCTVGEDRTGMLAGMFRMVEMGNQGWNVRRAFDEEMCQNGYEAGNPDKPEWVVGEIRKELTPIFLKLATLVESGAISAGHLDPAVCAKPVTSRYDAADFTCKASPLHLQGTDRH
jgi:hypothetical protein